MDADMIELIQQHPGKVLLVASVYASLFALWGYLIWRVTKDD